ncbi:MAG TPA: hypothetical protein VGC97_22800 [Pyrinomonadaceae bacterium]
MPREIKPRSISTGDDNPIHSALDCRNSQSQFRNERRMPDS